MNVLEKVLSTSQKYLWVLLSTQQKSVYCKNPISGDPNVDKKTNIKDCILMSTAVKTTSKNCKWFESHRSLQSCFLGVPWLHYLDKSNVPH